MPTPGPVDGWNGLEDSRSRRLTAHQLRKHRMLGRTLIRVNSTPSLARICDGLEFLVIELEEKRNAANKGLISAAASQVNVCACVRSNST
jgi:hypothetical protein